jgi:hypothetical protein
VVRQPFGLSKGSDFALLKTIEARFRSPDPNGVILALCQALDRVMREPRDIDARVVIEGGTVESDEARPGANPQEPVPRFKQGGGRVLEQAILTLPDAVGMGRKGPGWVQRESRDGHP